MQLSFTGDIDEIEAGLAVIGPMLGFQTAPTGCPSRSSAPATTASTSRSGTTERRSGTGKGSSSFARWDSWRRSWPWTATPT